MCAAWAGDPMTHHDERRFPSRQQGILFCHKMYMNLKNDRSIECYCGGLHRWHLENESVLLLTLEQGYFLIGNNVYKLGDDVY